MQRIIFGFIGFAILIFVGSIIPSLTLKTTIIAVVAFIIAVSVLVDLKTGLLLLVFGIPYTQQLNMGRLAGCPIDVGTDDLIIIIIIFSWLATIARRKEPHFLKTPLNWSIGAFFTAAMFSFIGSGIRFGFNNIVIGILHLFKFFEYVMIYFIVVSAIENIEEVKKFLKMFFAVTGVVVVTQIIAVIVYGTSSLSPPYVGRDNLAYFHSMYSFVSNSILGAYYLFFLSILLAILIDAPFFKGKVPLVIFAIAMSFGLFNTYSRSAYVGFVASFLILTRFKSNRLLLILLFLVLFTPVYFQSAILERITFTVQSVGPNGVVLDESSAIRLVLWKQAIQAFLKAPIFGMGYWTTRYALGGYEAHNQFLALLVETGVVGFSIFCWLLVKMYKNALALFRKAEDFVIKGLAVGYIAGLSGILVTCFFGETLEAFRMIGPLWFVTALITCANRFLDDKEVSAEIDST
jgi:O-antigen ligase